MARVAASLVALAVVALAVATAGVAWRPAEGLVAAVLLAAALTRPNPGEGPAALAPGRVAARWAVGLLLAVGVVHLLPLPAALRAVVAPGPAAVRADLARLGLQGSWAPISADVGGTVAELLLWAAAAALLALLPGRGRAPAWAAAGAVALLAAHLVAWADWRLGGLHFPVPDVPDPWQVGQDAVRRDAFSGWLVGPNHFAALGLLLWPLAAARALARGPTALRGAAVAVAVAVAVSVAETGSRSGALALGVQALVLAGWAVVNLARRRPAAAWGLGLAGFVVVVAAALLAAPRFSATDLDDRVALHQASVRMGAESPWLGWGLGAFGAAFPPWTPAAAAPGMWADHAHDDALQLWVEGGVPGAAAVLLLAWVALRGLRDRRVPGRARCAWGLSIAGAALVSLVELPFQVPAVRLAWLAVLFAGPGALAFGEPALRSADSTSVDLAGRGLPMTSGHESP